MLYRSFKWNYLDNPDVYFAEIVALAQKTTLKLL